MSAFGSESISILTYADAGHDPGADQWQDCEANGRQNDDVALLNQMQKCSKDKKDDVAILSAVFQH